jgi:hypothetical protein
MLEIGVHGKCILAAGVFQTGPQCHLLTGVPGERNDAYSPVFFTDLVKRLFRRIVTSIIDENYL